MHDDNERRYREGRACRQRKEFAGVVARGDSYRCDPEMPEGAVLIDGVDIIGSLPEKMPDAQVVLRLCGAEVLTQSGDALVEKGFGYSEWTPTDEDVWVVGGLDVVEAVLKHEGKYVELAISWEAIDP